MDDRRRMILGQDHASARWAASTCGTAASEAGRPQTARTRRAASATASADADAGLEHGGPLMAVDYPWRLASSYRLEPKAGERPAARQAVERVGIDHAARRRRTAPRAAAALDAHARLRAARRPACHDRRSPCRRRQVSPTPRPKSDDRWRADGATVRSTSADPAVVDVGVSSHLAGIAAQHRASCAFEDEPPENTRPHANFQPRQPVFGRSPRWRETWLSTQRRPRPAAGEATPTLPSR